MFIAKIKLNQLLFVLTLLLSFLLVSCAEDEKCYTCKGYQGNFPVTLNNICGIGPGGEPLVNYYRNIGYSCSESKSTSKSSSNITGPEENATTQINTAEEDNSDCPCNNKKNNNENDSDDNYEIE